MIVNNVKCKIYLSIFYFKLIIKSKHLLLNF
jgi:hypothetical protein